MKRVAGLRDLSDDHHTALVLARRCRQAAQGGDAAALGAAWSAVRDAFARELEPHFAIEERHLLPALEAIGEAALAERIRADHAALRAQVGEPAPRGGHVEAFGRLLDAHVRFEEREVFEPVQHRLAPAALAAIAAACAETRRACSVRR
ncbi:MAG: hemerythrin domain-containing protein [Proteobacteria bacterium]|nr:MAG: hemerythrin domain-containing protein [Pseudomonadota bacterium]